MSRRIQEKRQRPKTSLGLLFLFFSLNSLGGGLLERITVEKVSPSGRFFLLPLGSKEGAHRGQMAIFYKKTPSSPHPKYTPLGEGRIVKVTKAKSFWHWHPYGESDLFKKEMWMQIKRDNRPPPSQKHTQKISEKVLSQEALQKEKRDVAPSRLLSKQEHFFPSGPPSREHSTPWGLDTTTPSVWRKGTFNEYGHTKLAFYPPPKALRTSGPLSKKKETTEWRKRAIGSVEKMNALPYGLDEFYADTWRGVRGEHFASGVYNQIWGKKTLSRSPSSTAVATIEANGPTFSASMTDDELRKFFIQTGIEEEIHRQKRAFHYKLERLELNLNAHSGVSEHSTKHDDQYKGLDYALSLGLEYPLGGLSDWWKRFSLGVDFEMGVGFYSLGYINGRFSDLSFRAYTYFYPLFPPHSLKKWMPYLGLGFRRGMARVSHPSFENNIHYSYLLYSLPSFRGGLKYRFKSGDTNRESFPFGLGFSIHLQFEPVNAHSDAPLASHLASRVKMEQWRFGFGASSYF